MEEEGKERGWSPCPACIVRNPHSTVWQSYGSRPGQASFDFYSTRELKDLTFLEDYQAPLSAEDIEQQIGKELRGKSHKQQGVVRCGVLVITISCFQDVFCLTTV